MKTKSILLKAKKLFAVLAAVMVLMSCAVIPAQAAGMDALTVRPLSTGVEEVDTMLDNLNGLITGLVKVIGGILCIYGILQVGMSFSGHDPSQRKVELKKYEKSSIKTDYRLQFALQCVIIGS